MKTKTSSFYRGKQEHNFSKKQKFLSILPNTPSILLYSTCLAIFITFYLIFNPTIIQYTSNIQTQNKTKNLVQSEKDSKRCDLFKGQWIRDTRGSLYNTNTCKTIPFKRNCYLNGRTDTDFLNWRWKPDECQLPRFSPKTFLDTFQGKTMAFIGDSIARNQMDSLLCLLSTVETPILTFKDSENKTMTWQFPTHNFTLMSLWSQFLVAATERPPINGTSTGGFNLQLDKVDTNWSEKLPTMDYAIFSDAHWFFRQNHLYENGNLIGSVYCQAPNVKDLGPGPAIRKAFKAAFEKINNCKNCKKIFTVLRTFSPAHFEGAWDKGGGCNKTQPIRIEEVDKSGLDWEYRRIQVEEIEKARKLGVESGNNFEILDVTEIMSMRVDGHPGVYWGNKWMKGYSDCIHWCLPGPIDAWNELLLEIIKRNIITIL